jgi:MFS family permease
MAAPRHGSRSLGRSFCSLTHGESVRIILWKSTSRWLIPSTVNTFGAYQTYYQSGILSSSSPSDISWIGSVQAFLLMLVGALTGPIYDAGYFRALLSVGSFAVVFGFMMLSLCSTYWQVILAQGICVGLGAGCLFVPSVAILSTYFSTRIATAMGLAAAGSSLGKSHLQL